MPIPTRIRQLRARQLRARAVRAATFAAVVASSVEARADDGPELQRPSHVARSVNGVARASQAPSSTPAPTNVSLATPVLPPSDVDDSPRTWKHSGFILDAKVGMLGCLRTICSGASGHAADPGVRVGGFVGGNVGGILEVGVQGAWGRLRADVDSNRNLLDLYGVDTAGLQAQIDRETGGMAEDLGLDGLDLDQLSVQDAELSSVQAGLGLRLHFVPRGRIDAWVGSGVGYELFRADYRTPSGDARIDFHGLGVPAQAGLNVFLTRRFAIGADFEYRWTHFGVGTLQHPVRDVTVPLSVLADRGFGADEIAEQLPRYWTAGITARLRV